MTMILKFQAKKENENSSERSRGGPRRPSSMIGKDNRSKRQIITTFFNLDTPPGSRLTGRLMMLSLENSIPWVELAK